MLDAHQLTLYQGPSRALYVPKLHLARGELVAVLGSSASGKTCLLRTLAGEPTGYQGQLALHDKALHTWSHRELSKYRAYLAHSSPMVFDDKVHDVIQIGLDALQDVYPHAEQEEVKHQVVQALDLGAYLYREYANLAASERRRVQIARVFAQVWPRNSACEDNTYDKLPSRLLILDQAFLPLDPPQRAHLWPLLTWLASTGVTIVLTSYDLNAISQHCSRVLLISHHKIFADGTPEDVLTSTNLQQALGWSVQKVQVQERSLFIPHHF